MVIILNFKKVILITGSGSGIGKEAAIELAKKGHKVYATTQYESEALEMNKIKDKLKLDLISFKLDILSKNDRDKISDLKLDVLINNAGINESGSIIEIDIEKFTKVYNTNIFAMLELTQIAIKNMIKQKSGRVIFISSLYGILSPAFLSPYASSKHAIESIAVSLKKELKKLENVDIDVCLIEPGSYYTGFNQEMILKQFRWMKYKSYFKNKLEKLKKEQMNKLILIEKYNLSPIIKQYIKAVEDKKCKMRYSKPLSQYIVAKLIQIFS